MCMTRAEIAELYFSQIEPHETANTNNPKYAEFLAFEEGLTLDGPAPEDQPEALEPADNFEFAKGVLDRFTDRNFR